ncbi:hypothetical protein DF040_27960 [Burkholderia cenocepacia]|nr:hypothetical protein DF040_27960 [Burkholderia cenocepacia]
MIAAVGSRGAERIPALLRFCVSAFLRFCVSAFLRSCVPAFLRSCVPAFLRSCVPAFLRSCVLAFLRSCVPAFRTPWRTTCHASLARSYLFRRSSRATHGLSASRSTAVSAPLPRASLLTCPHRRPNTHSVANAAVFRSIHRVPAPFFARRTL